MGNFSLNQLTKALITIPYAVVGNTKNKIICRLSTPGGADENSLIWISTSKVGEMEIIANTRAQVIICGPDVNIQHFPDKCFIVSENPKLTFVRIANTFFKNKIEYGIHPTAIIHPEAQIHEHVYIGPFVYIGFCNIAEGVVIQGHSYLGDNVMIGKNTEILAGCQIGVNNLTHVINECGEYESFPHVGGVVIGENVELCGGSFIGRGVLGNTVIGDCCKIDANVMIGHNVVLEENVLIMPRAVIGGSAIIRKQATIAMNATIADYVEVGAYSHIGPGAIIVNPVLEGQKVASRPALPLPANFSKS